MELLFRMFDFSDSKDLFIVCNFDQFRGLLCSNWLLFTFRRKTEELRNLDDLFTNGWIEKLTYSHNPKKTFRICGKK